MRFLRLLPSGARIGESAAIGRRIRQDFQSAIELAIIEAAVFLALAIHRLHGRQRIGGFRFCRLLLLGLAFSGERVRQVAFPRAVRHLILAGIDHRHADVRHNACRLDRAPGRGVVFRRCQTQGALQAILQGDDRLNGALAEALRA